MDDPRLHGFEMIEKLGEGGTAPVWKARQVSLDRIVAVKVLPQHLATDPEDVKRFQSEAQSAAKLKHPGIVQVYDARAEGGLYYIVMEYVAGYTVGDWLRRKRVLPEKDALLVADCVADALGYAWRKEGIVHCDIKPDNVFIDSDGTVKVGDLGLARISALQAQSLLDEVMGTPAYIAPEQAMGEGALDCRTDMYSLGATMYHMVTGRMLFHGRPESEVMDLQVHQSDDDPMDVNPEICPAMAWLIEKLLAKMPSDRPEGWQVVRDDIARVKKKLPPRVKLPEDRPSTVRRSRKRLAAPAGQPTTRRGRVKKAEEPKPAPTGLIAAAIGAGILLILGVILMTKALSKPRRPVPGRPPTRVERLAPTPTPEPSAPAPDVSTQEEASRRLDEIRQWLAQNPASFEEGMGRLAALARDVAGTPMARMVSNEMYNLRRLRRSRVDAVITSLRREAVPMMGRGEYLEAARLFESYTGKFAAETMAVRMRQARQFRERARDGATRTERVEPEQLLGGLMDEVVSRLMKDGAASAAERVRAGAGDRRLSRWAQELRRVGQVLEAAAGLDRRVLRSFESSIGERISVQLTGGQRSLVIEAVEDGIVRARQETNRGGAVSAIDVSFGVEDLSVREKLLRMGSDEQAEVALVKGLMALRSSAYAYARKYFGMTEPLLGERLKSAVDKAEKGDGVAAPRDVPDA